MENGYKKINHCKIGKEKVDLVLSLIKDKFPITEIAHITKLDNFTVLSIAKENNLIIERMSVPRSPQNSNFLDDYFENIDSEEKAYFVGLIYADGTVRIHNGRYYLSLELKQEDEYMVKKLADALNCSNNILIRDRTTQFASSTFARFESCNSKKLFDDLSLFGIIPDISQFRFIYKHSRKNTPLFN